MSMQERRFTSLIVLCRRLVVLLAALGMSAALSAADEEPPHYDLRYTVELRPDTRSALVTIEVDDASMLRELDFNIDPDIHDGIQGNGEVTVADGRALWRPPNSDARLSLRAKIRHERDPGEYDAWIDEDWALFRGDDLVPPARVAATGGALARAILEFKLPEDWPSVHTGWESIGETRFRIDNPERRFDRPTGWMIAGKLGTRKDRLGSTDVSVSAPRGSGSHRMDVLGFLNFVWPEIEKAFQQVPPRLLVVGAGDPMWRGGLSASNSFFLHAGRPLVSENGTSSLIHELVHMVTRIRKADEHDWIVEGIAEFYAVELLYRAGGMTPSRREKVFADLADWGKDVNSLIARNSTGATTARAAVLFAELDQELREHSDGRFNLDDLVRTLMTLRDVSVEDLRRIAKELAGTEVVSLHAPALWE